ncbi:MAG TPA: YciI family protein [Actinomycetota bacterium]
MRYMLLIYGDENAGANLPPEELQRVMDAWWGYEDWIRGTGWHREGDALQPTATATTVEFREGESVTVDGPFAETKEQLGGYYLLDCENLDQAIEAARKMPVGPGSKVEVRPIQEFERPES